MLNILKKIFLILLLSGLNLYICEYFSNKLTSRMELRRGYRINKEVSIGFPMIRFLKILSNDRKISIWTVFIFLLSFLIWSAVPLSSNLVLVENDYSLIISISFYLFLIVALIFNLSESSYRKIFSENTKKLLILITFVIPVLLSVISIVLINKTTSLKEIVNSQYRYWNIIMQPLGFLTFFASTSLQFRLLGVSRKGYLSEGTGIGREGKGLDKVIEKISVYMIIFFLIIIMALIYLGGWQNMYIIRGEIMLALKFYLMFFILLLVDRIIIRIDNYKMLIKINFRILIPVSLVNFIVTFSFFILRDIYNFI
ncbi:MAG: NADH-quinone oxidoreductase subunit H [Actinomycetota bacterium]|nr:NADH-quinone oxidoreductase subunit H [Actinomycetota bacterium]